MEQHQKHGYLKELQSSSIPIAIFVARFDTALGNVIDFIYPESSKSLFIDQGLEFKSIPAGSHLCSSDIIYTSCGDHGFAICAYEQYTLPESDVDFKKNRGARSASVGILETKFSNLGVHIPFLKAMATAFSSTAEKHKFPYHILEEYFQSLAISNHPPLTSTNITPRVSSVQQSSIVLIHKILTNMNSYHISKKH